LEAWIRQYALPLWADRGFNSSAGAFYERLLPGGSADRRANIRVRVQARQIFVYAMAHVLGWYPGSRPMVEKALAFVDTVAVHPVAGKGYTHLLDHRFKVIDGKQDLYDHAFFILAYAWCYRAFGNEAALRKAVDLVEYFDRAFASGHGGWREGDYPAEYRRQNPHMHWLEAFLALYDATGEARWLAKAGEVVRLFETRFYDPGRQVLLEYFTDDWTPVTDAGELVEPGHLMEWVWLLRGYESRTQRPVSHFADALYDKVHEIGLSPSGLLFDEVKADGGVIKATKRCWPMTEYIKAGIAQARAGRPQGAEHAAVAIDRLFEYYICDERNPGLYIDRRGADDEIVDEVAPASTLYHLIAAAAEASAYCRPGVERI
jgi:mannose-6-phosphate isomerase